MQKTKTLFICTHCDTQYPKWLGQCSECGKWGTIVESVASASQEPKLKTSGAKPSDVVDLGKLETSDQPRKSTGISEVDRVLGGGIVPGTLMVLGG
ncbi:MAG: DNA repair protein RadA, partial [Candidatus Kerfeldbacteria bacterium]|nr:DNA repair protein RadA [Candidatus Kerfeldbacteria bacterium]